MARARAPHRIAVDEQETDVHRFLRMFIRVQFKGLNHELRKMV